MYINNTQSYLSAYSQWQHCDSGSRECEGRRSRVHLCHWWKCHHTLARLGFICKIHVLQSPLLFHFCIHYASLHPLPNPLLHISILYLLSPSPPSTAPFPSLYIHSLYLAFLTFTSIHVYSTLPPYLPLPLPFLCPPSLFITPRWPTSQGYENKHDSYSTHSHLLYPDNSCHSLWSCLHCVQLCLQKTKVSIVSVGWSTTLFRVIESSFWYTPCRHMI